MKLAEEKDIKNFIESQHKLFDYNTPPYYDTLSSYQKKQIKSILYKKNNEWEIEWNLPNRLLARCSTCETIAPLSVHICPVCGEVFD